MDRHIVPAACLLVGALALDVLTYPLVRIWVVGPARRAIASAGRPVAPRDERGIAMQDQDGRAYYNPTTVFLEATNYREYLFRESGTSSPAPEPLVLATYEWLREHIAVESGSAYFVYEYDWIYNECTAPWKSGMAQGLALSFLSRNRERLPADEAATFAKLITNSFFVPYERGGFALAIDGCPGRWYLEYPCGQPDFVLDGFETTLVGLHDCWIAYGFEEAKRAFDDGVVMLKCRLPLYVTDNWSRSDLGRGRLSDEHYHAVQTKLLERLAGMTGDADLDRFAEEWRSHRFVLGYSVASMAKSRMFYALAVAEFAVLLALYTAVARRRRKA